MKTQAESYSKKRILKQRAFFAESYCYYRIMTS